LIHFVSENCSKNILDNFTKLIEDFKKDNIVILKGNSPHEFSNVFHEWIENQDKTLEVELSPDDGGGMWRESKIRISNFKFFIDIIIKTI
jgi:hypothetical protein